MTKENRNKNIVKYSSMLTQMGLIIGLGAYLGVQLDEKLENDKKIMTALCSLFGVFSALYLIIRNVKKQK